MAGRKLALKTIDWIAFGETIPQNQKAIANSLKSCNETLTSRLPTLSENPPAINWDYYKANVAKAALEDDFEKKFNSCAKWVPLSKARIVEYEKQMEKIKNLIPFEQISIEDLNEAFPETNRQAKYP
nr:ATP synthase subunit d, mitochondrial-like [Saimiri boliviensis boliviensis]